VWDVEAGAGWDADAFTFLASVSRPLLCDVAVTAGGSRAVTEADVQGDAPRYGRSLLWDTSDGSLLAVVPGLLAGFSADGSRMIMSDGPSLSIVESSTGAVVTTITDDPAGTIASPDGTRLMRVRAANEGGSGVVATIYDTQTLTPIAMLSAGDGEMAGFEDPVFDDTNRRLAALDASGVTIWDATTGAELQHLDIELAPNGRSVTFSPGGLMIAVRNGTHLAIFDSSSGVELADLELDTQVDEIVFSPDDVRMAAGAAGNVVRVWSYARTG
jgi:WD40 repeat protein